MKAYLLLMCTAVLPATLAAQHISSPRVTPSSTNTYALSLQEAIALTKSNNKWVKAARTETMAASSDLKDAYNAALPLVNLSSSYQRYSDLTRYTDGLGKAITGPRKATPNAANLGFDASYVLYAGGKQKAFEGELQSREKIATLNAVDQENYYGLQTASQYLNQLRLGELKKFILDQLKRAETRLKTISTLYKNQKVTRSDVLRAEVMLSDVQLSMQQVNNDLLISNQQLGVLLNLPDAAQIITTDSAGMAEPMLQNLSALSASAAQSAFSIQKAQESIRAQAYKLKGLKSNYLPSLSFYTAYGINYPNNLLYPPVDQAYSIGFVGIRAQYNLSSLYQNKHKVAAGGLRVKQAQVQAEAIADGVVQQAKSMEIKYAEALNRIQVKHKNIEQAQANYRIVSTKYYNQLALLTDLLDADNLLTASRFDLVTAETDALTIYYRLLYLSGKL